MRSTLTGRRRAVPFTFAVLIAVLAGLFTLTVGRGQAHASGTTGQASRRPLLLLAMMSGR